MTKERAGARADRAAADDDAHRDRAVYIISVAAELAGVHPQTLRIYERKGLLRPARTKGNTRRYSQRDIDQLRTIQRLTQDQGLNLAGVKMIVELQRELERMQAEALRLVAELARMQGDAAQGGRRNPPSEIVPLSAARRVRLRVSTARRSAASGPIAVGPATTRSPGPEATRPDPDHERH